MLQLVERIVLDYMKTNPEVLERIMRALLDRLVAELEERIKPA
jgi:hypothetical protein